MINAFLPLCYFPTDSRSDLEGTTRKEKRGKDNFPKAICLPNSTSVISFLGLCLQNSIFVGPHFGPCLQDLELSIAKLSFALAV